jgi:hypothetical protein
LPVPAGTIECQDIADTSSDDCHRLDVGFALDSAEKAVDHAVPSGTSTGTKVGTGTGTTSYREVPVPGTGTDIMAWLPHAAETTPQGSL